MKKHQIPLHYDATSGSWPYYYRNNKAIRGSWPYYQEQGHYERGSWHRYSIVTNTTPLIVRMPGPPPDDDAGQVDGSPCPAAIAQAKVITTKVRAKRYLCVVKTLGHTLRSGHCHMFGPMVWQGSHEKAAL